MPTGMPTKEAKVEMKTHLVTVETKISKFSIEFNSSQKNFMLLTHQLILVYFFSAIISSLIYIFQFFNLKFSLQS